MTDLDFNRDICRDLGTAENREWLVTNGIGGYASGTIANLLTRRYHGLLIAALKPPLGRTLLATKLDETIRYAGYSYPLFTNRWAGGILDPHGYRNIERFHLDGTIPVWTFAFKDALLEKRLWMQPGANTTYIHYHLLRGSAPLEINASTLVNYRDFHGETKAGGWLMDVQSIKNGLRILAFNQADPFHVLSNRAIFELKNEWYYNFSLRLEQNRGFAGLEDHLHAGEFHAGLTPGETLTIVISTDPDPNLDGERAFAERRAFEAEVAGRAPNLPPRLTLAADQFVISRSNPAIPNGHSILAGYHWFGDWGRDTMISLPGLTLATGRPEIARSILKTFAQFVSQGMLPNRFPDDNEIPEYNTVDATLWYFEAIRAYHDATGDESLLTELFPILTDIIAWHERGTRYQIHLDLEDGLLYAGKASVQLTWMDAKWGDWVVTPRIGKPVEINALWYNALRSMTDFCRVLKQPFNHYVELADQAQTGFGRFWNKQTGYCFDVLDTPGGHDPSLRPNQLFAVSLHHSPLSIECQKAVVDVCARTLLTPYGLRSLAPEDDGYIGHYGGDARQRDGAYHQGTIWGWLIGPFVSAHLRVYSDPLAARSFLEPFYRQFAEHGVGSISEIFDGDPPFAPRGCIAQAWSVAELIRASREVDLIKQ